MKLALFCLIFLVAVREAAGSSGNEVPEPVLKIEFPDNFYPLLNKSFRDPRLNLRFREKNQLGILQNQLQLYRSWIGGKATKKSDYRQMEYFGTLVRLSYYWQNQKHVGKSEKKGHRKNASQMVKKYHDKIRTAGKKIFKRTRDKRVRNWVKYHVALVNFLYPERRARAVKWLTQLSKAGLSARQRQTVQLGISLYNSMSKNRSDQDRALKTLKTLQNLLPKNNAMVAHLAVSYILSEKQGRSQSGSVRPSDDYALHLKFVSSLCQNLSRSQRSDLFVFSLRLWMRAEKNRPDWGKPPFRMDCYKELPGYIALKERTGLYFWSQNNFSKARKIYVSIAERHKDSQEKILLEERAVQLYRLQYERDGRPFPYQDYLMRLGKGYDGSLFGVRLVNLQYRLILNEIRKRHSKSPAGNLDQLESMMKKFLTSQKPDFRTHKLQVLLAELYTGKKLFARAEKVYGNLYRESAGERKRKYLVRQISVQTKVAGWNVEDPWKEKPEPDKGEQREHLLRLYYTLLQSDKTLDWAISRHIGLLEIALNRTGKAFIIWENALKDFPKGRDAQLALGMLIDMSEKGQKWEKLESLVYLGLEKAVRAHLGQKPFNLRKKLEQALYKNAVSYRQAERHKKAIKKLVVLENTYDQSVKYSEYLYLLADSYKKTGNFEKSLSTLEQILALKSGVPWYREALMESARFYTGLADLEKSILLYQMYLQKFPGDPGEVQIRLLVSDLYTGLSKYPEARNVLSGIDESKLGINEYQLLNEKYFFLTKNAPREKRLNKAVETVKNPRIPEMVKVRSLRLLAENAYQNQNSTELRKISGTLRTLSQARAIVSDTLSYVSYLEVRLQSEAVMRSFKKVLTEDFPNVVSFLDASYRDISKSFRAVCKRPGVAYCVPGMQALMAFNRKIQSFLEDVTPAQNMSEENRNVFLAEQQGLRVVLAKDFVQIMSESRSLLARGNTNPAATRQLLWSAGKDWNFRFGQDSGPGFMQISRDHLLETEGNVSKKL